MREVKQVLPTLTNAAVLNNCPEPIFQLGDLVQLKSATGTVFPVLTVNRIVPFAQDKVTAVEVTYFNSAKGCFEGFGNPQQCFVPWTPKI